jgi:catechol 2,3-dioxygenase-like lactoylglutathione lyase family enzyme
MKPTIAKISAITLRVMNMKTSVAFYQNVLGMELLYGGEQSSFSSLRPNDSESAILNLEQGDNVSRWGRLIFHVADWPRDGLRAPLGTGFGRFPIERKISVCTAPVAHMTSRAISSRAISD